jgi:molecular chaperone DnaK
MGASGASPGDAAAGPRAVLLDVTPRALGIAVSGGFAEKIVDRNVPVPVEQTRMFATSADNQTMVKIQVCQGESKYFDENVPLGDLDLPELPPAPRGDVKIEVTFRVDTDGILRVRARDAATGVAREATVNVRGTMTQSEVEVARRETAQSAARGTASLSLGLGSESSLPSSLSSEPSSTPSAEFSEAASPKSITDFPETVE